MIYQELAPYYDRLVQDEEATRMWVDFVQAHCTKGNMLELACGSGDIAIQLAKLGYDMIATDYSEAMMDIAKTKEDQELVNWQSMDMRDFHEMKPVDGILCFCDSLNYLLEETELLKVFKQSYQQLQDDGVLLFDVHSKDRIKEFEEEYVEDGYLDTIAYQWSIYCEDDDLFQTFAFYDEEAKVRLEQHHQRIYDPNWLMKQAIACGFEVRVFTDFTKEGIWEGEKYFYVCRKKGNV